MSESDPKMTPVVAAIGQMHLEGNVIPHTWYKAIVYDSGKPDVNAILILAEIIYWYRPTIKRDEYSGEIVSVHKKFSADMLHRSYQSFADQFGLTKRQCQDAVTHLVELGLIAKETRVVDTPRGKVGNVLFLAPIPHAIQRISSYVETYKGIHPNVGASYTETHEPYTSERSTYTENTTQTSTENTPEKERTNGLPARAPDPADSFVPLASDLALSGMSDATGSPLGPEPEAQPPQDPDPPTLPQPPPDGDPPEIDAATGLKAVDLADCIALLTADEVGMSEADARQMAIVSHADFAQVERHVFAWLDHRSRPGARFTDTKALMTRIECRFSAPEPSPEQKDSPLYERFHKKFSGGGYDALPDAPHPDDDPLRWRATMNRERLAREAGAADGAAP